MRNLTRNHGSSIHHSKVVNIYLEDIYFHYEVYFHFDELLSVNFIENISNNV